MSGDEEDVDSGWDEGEDEAPVTRAVDSARLLANFRGRLRESETNTPALPPGSSVPPLVDEGPASEPPTTRRASEEELKQMRTRAAGSAIRLGGRKPSPPAEEKAPVARRTFDPIHSRPTPPAGVVAPRLEPAKPAAPAISAGRSLRLAAENLPKKILSQQRRATLVNRPLAAGAEPRPASQPPLDLHLDGLDLLGDLGSASAASIAPPPSEKALPSRAERSEAATRPPPPLEAELDTLPVDEMLATARSSRPPPEPRAPAARAPEPVASAAPVLPRAPRAPAGGGAGPGSSKLPAGKPLASLAAKRKVPAAAPSRPAAQVVVEQAPPLPVPEPPRPPESGDGVPESTIEIEEDGAALSDEESLALLSEEDPDLLPIQERFERGDYFGAALRAEALLEQQPDHEAAQRYLSSAHDALAQMYMGRLGSGEQVLRVAMRPDEIQGLSLDHRSGFLISLIDGVATLDEVLDMSGMPQLDALRLLYEMREQGVVVVDSMRL